jgi:hypothetical protein
MERGRDATTQRDAPDERVAKAYKFADLSQYPFKKRLMIRAADLVFYWLIRVIGKTVRWEIEGWEHWEAATKDGKIPIYTFWHDRVFLSTYFWREREIVVMTSQSFDGEYIARFIQRFGYGAARGSSTRGGIGALVEMVRLMKAGKPAAFTIDGPKGPRYVAKPGAVLLAKKTQNPVLPFCITPAKYWQINSWDKFQIPKPFTRALLTIAPPLFVVANAGDETVSARQTELQSALDALTQRGEQWRIENV